MFVQNSKTRTHFPSCRYSTPPNASLTTEIHPHTLILFPPALLSDGPTCSFLHLDGCPRVSDAALSALLHACPELRSLELGAAADPGGDQVAVVSCPDGDSQLSLLSEEGRPLCCCLFCFALRPRLIRIRCAGVYVCLYFVSLNVGMKQSCCEKTCLCVIVVRVWCVCVIVVTHTIGNLSHIPKPPPQIADKFFRIVAAHLLQSLSVRFNFLFNSILSPEI